MTTKRSKTNTWRNKSQRDTRGPQRHGKTSTKRHKKTQKRQNDSEETKLPQRDTRERPSALFIYNKSMQRRYVCEGT